MHPDRGGSSDAFQAVTVAHRLLSDKRKLQDYVTGADLPRENYDDPSLREQIEARYFPERQGFRAFGDPFKAKREVMQKKRREAEEREAELLRLQQEQELEDLAVPPPPPAPADDGGDLDDDLDGDLDGDLDPDAGADAGGAEGEGDAHDEL